MSISQLDTPTTGDCSPDGSCAVVDREGARIGQPAMVVPGAMDALQALGAAIAASGLSLTTIELVNLRVSQINGCGFCVDLHPRMMKKAGETDRRILSVAAWR